MLHALIRPAVDDAERLSSKTFQVEASRQPAARKKRVPPMSGLLVGGMAAVWAVAFGWLAVQRHLAGGSNAEDLGFTDQVLGNFLRGQWFRMSIYQGGTWNTEIDISRLARPDSLLAFHFEPMLLLLVPLYALGGGATLLLVIQAVALAAGGLPAYRLGQFATGSARGGMALATTYFLSPLGQWAVLSDFHTSALAAPLLVLAVERLVVGRAAWQALLAAALAATAREDVGPLVALLGLVLVLGKRRWRLAGLRLLALGIGWTILAEIVIRHYSGGVFPFDARYGHSLGSGISGWLGLLDRPLVLHYARTLVLSGAWLGLLAPLALVPALPSLAVNALSSSPWMAAGRAHYSSLVLPVVVVAAAAGLRRLKPKPLACNLACAGLVLTSLAAYSAEGAGPLGGNYAPATVTDHARAAASIADNLPADASVSASSSLVPRVSRRARVYVFPAVLDADYIFLDLQASPAPTSAGDVYLRARSLLANGGWNIESAADGLLLVHRAPDAPPVDTADLSALFGTSTAAPTGTSLGHYFDGRVDLISASMLPSPDGALDVDGPRWVLHTVWLARQALPAGTHVDVWLSLRDGRRILASDTASLWWNPPERWTPGQPVSVDIPNVSAREFASWQAEFSE